MRLAHRAGMIRNLLVIAALLTPSAAAAHMRMVTPPPRDEGAANADAHKTAPCGGVARSAAQKVATYAPGSTVNVLVEETIDHVGCFKVQFANAGDTGWTTLATVNDPANAGIDRNNPATYRKVTIPVTMPTAPCNGCTLRVTQLMLGRACNNTDTAEGSDTYYSCANVRLQAGTPDGGVIDSGTQDAGPVDASIPPHDHDPEPEAGAPVLDASVTEDAGEEEMPTYRPVIDPGGGLSCATTPGLPATAGTALALLALALLRARRP